MKSHGASTRSRFFISSLRSPAVNPADRSDSINSVASRTFREWPWGTRIFHSASSCDATDDDGSGSTGGPIPPSRAFSGKFSSTPIPSSRKPLGFPWVYPWVFGGLPPLFFPLLQAAMSAALYSSQPDTISVSPSRRTKPEAANEDSNKLACPGKRQRALREAGVRLPKIHCLRSWQCAHRRITSIGADSSLPSKPTSMRVFQWSGKSGSTIILSRSFMSSRPSGHGFLRKKKVRQPWFGLMHGACILVCPGRCLRPRMAA